MAAMETGSNCARLPRVIHILDALMQVSPWTWIAAIFSMQTLGAIGVARMFQLQPSEIALPISLLALGACVALFFRRTERGRELRLWKWWIPPAIYALFIFLLSNRSFSGAQVNFNVNLFHPVEYLTLGLLTSWAWYPFFQRRGTLAFAGAVLLSGAFFGLSDELHQSLVPGRTMSVADLYLDLTGLTLGFLIFLAFRFLRRVHEGACDNP